MHDQLKETQVDARVSGRDPRSGSSEWSIYSPKDLASPSSAKRS